MLPNEFVRIDVYTFADLLYFTRWLELIIHSYDTAFTKYIKHMVCDNILVSRLQTYLQHWARNNGHRHLEKDIQIITALHLLRDWQNLTHAKGTMLYKTEMSRMSLSKSRCALSLAQYCHGNIIIIYTKQFRTYSTHFINIEAVWKTV